MQRDAWAYADRLTGVTARERHAAARTFAAAEAAYVYGLPLVELHDTVRQFRFRNTIISIAALTDPETKAGRVAQRRHGLHGGLAEPDPRSARHRRARHPRALLHLPVHGRLHELLRLRRLSGSTGTEAGSYVLVPPGLDRRRARRACAWSRSPTRTIWLLGRTLVDDAADLEEVKPLLREVHRHPARRLAHRRARQVDRASTSRRPQQRKPATPTGHRLRRALNQDSTVDPPPATPGLRAPGAGPCRRRAARPLTGRRPGRRHRQPVGNPPGSDQDTAQNRAVEAGHPGRPAARRRRRRPLPRRPPPPATAGGA